MNLKKIIRETIKNSEDDWSWANFDPIEPRKKGEIRVGDVYTIYGSGYEIRYRLEVTEFLGDEVMYQLLITSDEEEEPYGSIQSTEFDNAKNLIKDNYWVLTSSLDGNLTESEEEGVNPFAWIRDVIPPVQITELDPNDMYRIAHISRQAFEDYMGDGDLLDYDPYTTLFIMDDKDCFEGFNGEENVWVKPFNPEDPGDGGWVSTDRILVNKVYDNDVLTEAKKKMDGFDWIRESDPKVKLEPNTLYYFEPNIGGDELVEFTDRFAPGYKNIGRWLRGLKDRTVKYFVTNETGKDTMGWCNMATLEEALEIYGEDQITNVINARDYFNI